MLSRMQNFLSEDYEHLEMHASLLDTSSSTVTGKQVFRSRSAGSLGEYFDPSPTFVRHPLSISKRDSGWRGSKSASRYYQHLFDFLRQNKMISVGLSMGITGSLICFAFTFWLSHQNFYCPPWTIHCTVKESVHRFASHLGLVQGLLTSVYGISVASVAYAANKLAETTLWPLLTELPLTLEAMDYYIAHTRGSLALFPIAAWLTRKSKFLTIVLIGGILGILLQASSTVVGWTFTVVSLNTTLHSNHTIGGGMGYGFNQNNPPAEMPGEPAAANAIYLAWSTGQSTEMLPGLREFVIDRTNLSLIGDFTVPALKARKSIHCYGEKLNITTTPAYTDFAFYTVGVASYLGGSEPALVGAGEVLLRTCPGALTVWVDSIWNTSITRGVTKLMFATFNGTIENGILNPFDSSDSIDCGDTYSSYPCSGISSLACEVDVDLVEGLACQGECRETHSKPLTSYNLTGFSGTKDFWELSAYLGAVPAVLGGGTYGAQPCFGTAAVLPNSSYALPTVYQGASVAGSSQWTVANITNFINVTSGALAIYMASAWPQGWTIVKSTLEMPRLDGQRAYFLLIPIGIALVCVVLVAALTVLMHCSAKVDDMTGGWSSEMVICTADGELRSLVDGIRAGYKKAELLEKKKLFFGQLADGHPGLSASARPFAESRGSAKASNDRESIVMTMHVRNS